MPAGKCSLARARRHQLAAYKSQHAGERSCTPSRPLPASCSAGRGKYKQQRLGHSWDAAAGQAVPGSRGSARGEFGLLSLAEPCLWAGGNICSLLSSRRKSCGDQQHPAGMFSCGLAARRVPVQIRVSVCEQHCGLLGQGDGKENSGLVCSAWKREAEIRGGFSHQEGLLSSVASLHLILTFRKHLAGMLAEESFCLLSWVGVCHPLPCSLGGDPFPAWAMGWRKQRDAQHLLAFQTPLAGRVALLQDFLLLGQSGSAHPSTEPPMARLWLSGLAKCAAYWPRQHFAVPEQ